MVVFDLSKRWTKCIHNKLQVGLRLGRQVRAGPAAGQHQAVLQCHDQEVRCRGGNYKFRALRLDTGNFSWGSEVRGQLRLCTPRVLLGVESRQSLVSFWLSVGVSCLQAVTRKTRVLDVVYNASNNELVRCDADLLGGVLLAALCCSHSRNGCCCIALIMSPLHKLSTETLQDWMLTLPAIVVGIACQQRARSTGSSRRAGAPRQFIAPGADAGCRLRAAGAHPDAGQERHHPGGRHAVQAVLPAALRHGGGREEEERRRDRGRRRREQGGGRGGGSH